MPTQSFRVGEMLPRRTVNSKTWMNFDGSYTTEIHSGPVHFEDENGNLQNINTDLFDEADFDGIDVPVAADSKAEFHRIKEVAKAEKKANKLNRAKFDFRTLKVPFDAKLSRNFKQGYSIGKGPDKLQFTPVDGSSAEAYVDAQRKNIVHYADAWNDTDITLEVTPTGIKETLVLKTDRAPVKFAFEVKGKDIADDFTAGTLKLMPAWLVDAAGTERDVEMIINRSNDNKVYVELTADVTGLMYPVEIDPTVVLTGASAIEDTEIDEGALDENRAQSIYFTMGSKGFVSKRALLKFDLNQINGHVKDAVLHLNFQAAYNLSMIHDYDFHRITESYQTDQVTWANQPAYDSLIEASLQTSGSEDADINLTSLVSKWVSGQYPNMGVLAKARREEDADTGRLFDSSEETEAAIRPKLTITYDQSPSKPTVTSPNGGEAWNSLHKIEFQPGVDPAEETEHIAVGEGNNTVIDDSVGQTYKVIKDGLITGVSFGINIDYGYSSSTYVTLKVKGLGADGFPNDTVYAQKTMLVPDDSVLYPNGLWVDVPMDDPLNVIAGQRYYFEFTTTSNIPWYANGSTAYSYPDGMAYYAGVPQTDKDLYFKVRYQQTAQTSHNIQLSTDNGVTWKDIIPLTAAGVTSAQYDFINEPETSTALIRVRAYDGTSYGPWDTSDGVFTIVHNQAPNAPLNLSPAGGTPMDRAKVNRLSWQHSDPNTGDPQAQFDLLWRLKGATSWNTVTQVTINQYWDAPAGTFPHGEIEWQVRTYDQAGLSSPYSTAALLFAGDKPAAATITSPADSSTVAVANPLVQWSSIGQVAYRLTVKDAAGAAVWTAEQASTNKAVTVGVDLANQTAYTIELAIKNADGLWSDTVSTGITVSYTPPATPTIEAVGTGESIAITITNPAPTGTQPALAHNDLFKRINSQWVRIVADLPAGGTYTDYAVSSDALTEYKVRAWGDNNTFADSALASDSIHLSGVYLHSVQDPQATLKRYLATAGGGRASNKQAEHQYMQFAGREKPVIEYGEALDCGMKAGIRIQKDDDGAERLERLVASRETVCYRDGRGRLIFGALTSVPLEDTIYGWDVEINVTEIDYSEEV